MSMSCDLQIGCIQTVFPTVVIFSHLCDPLESDLSTAFCLWYSKLILGCLYQGCADRGLSELTELQRRQHI